MDKAVLFLTLNNQYYILSTITAGSLWRVIFKITAMVLYTVSSGIQTGVRVSIYLNLTHARTLAATMAGLCYSFFFTLCLTQGARLPV